MVLMKNSSLPTQSNDHAGNDNNYCNRSKASSTSNASRMIEHISRTIASASFTLLNKVAPPFTQTCELMNQTNLHNDVWTANDYFLNNESFVENNLGFTHNACKVVNTNKCLRVGSSARCDQASTANARLNAYPIDTHLVYHALSQLRVRLYVNTRLGAGAHA